MYSQISPFDEVRYPHPPPVNYEFRCTSMYVFFSRGITSYLPHLSKLHLLFWCGSFLEGAISISKMKFTPWKYVLHLLYCLSMRSIILIYISPEKSTWCFINRGWWVISALVRLWYLHVGFIWFFTEVGNICGEGADLWVLTDEFLHISPQRLIDPLF